MFVRYISRPLDVLHGAEINRAPLPCTQPSPPLHPQPQRLAPICGSGSRFFFLLFNHRSPRLVELRRERRSPPPSSTPTHTQKMQLVGHGMSQSLVRVRIALEDFKEALI